MSVHRNIRILSWFNFCNDFRLYNAVAVIYFAQVTGSYALAGLLFAIAKVASAAFDVPTGVISDLAGRKLTLVAGQIASAASIACYALGRSFAILAVGAVLEGLSFALFSGNNDALLYDTLNEENRPLEFAEFQGRVTAMFQFALAVSALLAVVVLRHSAFRSLYWLSVVPQLIGLVLALLLVEPSRKSAIANTVTGHLREAASGIVRDRRLRLMSLGQIIAMGLGETKFMFLPAFYAMVWPPWALPFARVISHTLAAGGFRFAGRIVSRLGERRILLGAQPLSITLALISIGLANAVSPVVYAATSLPFGPASVAQGSLMQKAFTDRQRATMASLVSFAGSLVYAVAISLAGLWADQVGPRFALLTVEILSISAIPIYWRLFGPARTAEQSRIEDQAS